jgi:hypothetical protein
LEKPGNQRNEAAESKMSDRITKLVAKLKTYFYLFLKTRTKREARPYIKKMERVLVDLQEAGWDPKPLEIFQQELDKHINQLED